MSKKAIRTSLFSTLFVAVAAIPILGLMACGAEGAGASDEALEPAAQSAPLLEGVRADADCGAVQGWVAKNADRLPTRYADVTAYPMPYRRAILANLAPEAKSSLWKEHFQHYLAEHPELTAKQVAFIEKLSSAASPELFGRSHEDPAVNAVMADLQKEGSTVFGEESFRLLGAQLGPETARGADAVSGATTSANATPICECSTKSNFCNSAFHCEYAVGDCVKVLTGCGFLGWYACNGQCYINL